MRPVEGYRLSPLQERALDLDAPPARLQIETDGPFDPVAAWDRMVARHEVLRTRFERIPGLSRPLQVVEPEGTRLHAPSIGAGTFSLELPAACADAGTLELIARELSGAEGAQVVPQYPDLAEELHERISEPEAWRERILRGRPARPFPFSRALGAEAFSPRSVSRVIATGPLALFARERSVPLEAVFLGAFTSLLVRFRAVGEETVVVGLLRSARVRPDLAGALGPLTRVVPIELGCRVDESVAALLLRIRSSLASADEDQWRVPPATLLGAGHLAFGFEHRVEVEPLRAGAATLRVTRIESAVDRFALRLTVVSGPERCRLELHHDSAVIEEADAQHLLDHLGAILEHTAREPGRMPHELALQPTAWPGPALRSERPPLAHEAIRARAREHPGRPAVVCGETTWTWADLLERVDSVARGLAQAGVGPGERVAFLLDRTPDLVAAHVATLQTGAAFLPLDPATPRARLRQLLAHARPRLVLVDDRSPTDLGVTSASIEELVGRADPRSPVPHPEVEPDQPAYVIATSGSTGEPKGLVISRSNLAWFLHLVGGPLDVRAEDRCLHSASAAFALSIRQLFLPLSRGATLVLASAEERAAPLSLLELISRERVTLIDLVPSFWASLIEVLGALESGERARLLENQLRQIVSIGEPLAADVPRAWRALGHGARLVNIYGQTETTGLVALNTIPAELPADPAIVPVGRALNGISLKILDPQGRPLPCLAPGDVWVESPTVALGYLDHPEGDAGPFSSDPGRTGLRRYCTGDLGLQRLDGVFQLIGRADQQVKIRGSRVELPEVEVALRKHPEVREAAVLVDRDGSEPRLAAFIVGRAAPPSDEALRAFLQEHIPGYMIPALFRPIDALPRTTTGKVDRPALLELLRSQGETRDPEKRTDLSQWFHVPTWRVVPRACSDRPADGGWLVFEDELGFARAALGDERFERAIKVRAGAGWRAIDARHYEINPGSQEDHERLVRSIAEQAHVAHFWNVTAPDAQASLERSYWSTTFLAGALARRGSTAWLHLVANGLEQSPAKRTLLGPVACLTHEPGGPDAQAIEVDFTGAGSPSMALIDALRAELLDPGAERELSFRGAERRVRDYARRELRRPDARSGRSGAWLITGGLGGLGLELALHLARTQRAPLVLVGTSAPSTPRQLERLVAIQSLGVPARVVRADVTNTTEMREVIARAIAEHGRLRGVIHAAGRRGSGCPVASESRSSSARVLAPKVEGTEALVAALQGARPDHLVLFGSISSAIGGPGLASYVAANAWLDAAALWLREQGIAERVLTLHWDTWTSVGMAATEAVSPVLRERHAQLLALGIATEEGLEVFDRALESDEARLVISTRDLAQRHLRAAAQLASEGRAPADPLERELAGVWGELLKRGAITTDVSFFHLGGHSLLAVRLLSRIHARWGRALPLSAFFAQPTIAALARHLRDRATDGPALAPFPPPPDPSAVPRLTRAQEGLWLEQERDPRDPAWNLPSAWRLRGALDAKRLEFALAMLVERHASLRTGVARGADGARPRPHEAPFRLERVDCGEAESFLAEQSARPFDLAREPPFRGALLRLGEEDHVLVLVAHHLACDGTSMTVLVRELVQAYGLAPLPESARPFGEFARWERSLEPRGEDIEWFRARLGAAREVLDLPLERPTKSGGARGCRFRFQVPFELRARLDTLARTEGATLFMALLAGFQGLLQRISGEDTIAVGVPFALRDHPETEGMVGLLLNTLVLATDCSGDPTFAELLGRTRETALGAYARRHLAFGELVTRLAPARVPDRHPVYQVMFGYEQHPAPPLALAGLDAAPLDTDSQGAVSELSLALEDQPHGLVGSVEYRADRFAPAAIERLVRSWLLLLEAASTDPQRRLSRLPLVPPTDREHLLAWGRGPVSSIPAVRVDALVRERSAAAPETAALLWRDTTISAGELASRASRLAAVLRARGVGAGHLVAVCVPRSPALVAAILGVLEVGAAYLPLDPDDPPLRRERILAAAAPSLTIVASDELAIEPSVHLDLEGVAGVDSASRVALALDRLPADAVHVVYTSGSTGEPKGVIGLHPALVNRLRWSQSRFPLAPGDVTCLRTSSSFIDAVCELFAPLLAGVAALVIEPQDARDPPRLLALLARHGVTRIVLVPALLRALLDAQARTRTALPRLGLIVSSGEALPLALARRCREQLPQARLLNLYGSTEVAADATWFDVNGLAPDAPAVPLGRPIDNLVVRVLDRHGDLAPVGIPGELHVGGAGLAAGYLDRPDFTAERFVPDPFVGDARLYRTGDLASWSSDGTLAFHGRLDRQLKVRGVRVEPDEVTRAILTCPGVKEAAVVVGRDPRGDPCLVAYVAPSEAAPGLLPALRERLPRAMLPARIVPLEVLPRTPSGKPDPERFPAPPPPSRQGRPPADHLERLLADLWAPLLGVDPGSVGAEEDFFALGGHSLLAVDLAARIADRLGRTVPLATLFEHPTVAEQAALLRDLGVRYRSLVALQPNGSRLPLFCVHPGSGDALVFRNLSRHLGPDQPIYAFQARGLDGEEAPLDRVEDMARLYLSELRQVQLHGPYQLLGRCFGGLVALEMGRRLRAEGEGVTVLILGRLRPPDLAGGLRSRKSAVRVIKLELGVWRRRVLRALRRSGGELTVPKGCELAEHRYRWSSADPGRVIRITCARDVETELRAWEGRWSTTLHSEGVVLDIEHGDMLREPHVAQTTEVVRRFLHTSAQP